MSLIFAAIIHYSPDPDDCAVIRKDQVPLNTPYEPPSPNCLFQMYLCDSGGLFINITSRKSVH